MGEGELDQFSVAIGRFEAGIEMLTEAVKDLRTGISDVVTAVHSHGERLDKIEPRLDTLHEHHTGRSAIWKFLRLIPYGAIGSGAGYVATYVPWKTVIGPLLR